MTKVYVAALLALLAVGAARAAPPDEKKCVFSIEVVAETLNGLHRPGDTAVGDSLFIYEHAGGWLTAERHEAWHGLGAPQPANDELWGGGKEFTARIREAFKAARLAHFDFDRQLSIAKRVSGEGFVMIGSRTVRVRADLEGTTFAFQCDGLGFMLDLFSHADPELGRLKALLDQVSLEYGRHRLFL